MVACGGGGNGSSSTPPVSLDPPAPVPAPTPLPTTPPPSPPPSGDSGHFATESSTSRFLTLATFGPTNADVASLTGTSASDWIQTEFNKPASPSLSSVEAYYNLGTPQTGMLADAFDQGATTYVFWKNAVEGDDQLRQRMMYALSQVLVVSNGSGGFGGIFPQTVGYYQQILSDHAFGNYRDLLEAVTYSPAMAEYLTYLGNAKADPVTGRVPDENYAREILQLFTIGLVELNADGSPVLDATRDAVEVYDNGDITELAKVFTGLRNTDLEVANAGGVARNRARIVQALQEPLSIDDQLHSTETKSFLGTTIPAGTPGAQSIDLALDHIMAHPNVGPFIGRQLIQRFVSSHPSPDYVERVATAFDTGTYILPDGSTVGEGRKGDLKATMSAVLFDADAQIDVSQADDTSGKIREPILRLTHFMRSFDADMSAPEYVGVLYDTSSLSILGQHPFRSPSVFNFYRPGYVAPGTESGALGLTVPELQIVNASSTPGYVNLLTFGAFGEQENQVENMRRVFTRFNAPFDAQTAQSVFMPDFSDLLDLADDAEGLIDHLNTRLLYGSMTEQTRQALIATVVSFPADALQDASGREDLIAYTVVMVMSSPDYIVQR
ncbi:MAG: DUF1800 domain-containing protein [Pseudomonadota bacterium]